MKRVRQLNEIHSITCDMCGESCREGDNWEYATVSAQWGFDSPWDGEAHQMHLCIRCYRNFQSWVREWRGTIRKWDYLRQGTPQFDVNVYSGTNND